MMPSFRVFLSIIYWFLNFTWCCAQSYQSAFCIGSTYSDIGLGTTIDHNGNTYVTGYFSGDSVDFNPGPGTAYLNSSGGWDIFIAKYDSSGHLLWANRIGGSGDDYGYGVRTDGSGNIYVAGSFCGTEIDFDPGPGAGCLSSAGYGDIFFAKYNASGNYQWAESISGPYGYENSHDFAVDSAGNVYLTGYFVGTADFDPGTGTANLSSSGSWDIFFSKYDMNGNYLWAKRIGGALEDVGNGLALDDSGNVYITGGFRGSNVDFNPGTGTFFLNSTGGQDIFWAKYDPSGNYLWVKRIGGANDEMGRDILPDHTGNVFLTGDFSGSGVDFDPGAGTALLSSAGNKDVYFAKYDAAGNHLWATNAGGTSDDFSTSMIRDESDNIYFIGGFQGTNIDFDPGPGTACLNSAGGFDGYFAKYDSFGHFVWAANIGGTGNDFINDIKIDNHADICLTGSIGSSNVDFDPGAGSVFLNSAGEDDIFFARYSQPVTATESNSNNKIPRKTILHQNYPNPFNPSTTIEFDLSENHFITLKIFNIMGQLVTTLLSEYRIAGKYSVAWNAEAFAGGIYIYRLQAGEYAVTKKLLLLK